MMDIFDTTLLSDMTTRLQIRFQNLFVEKRIILQPINSMYFHGIICDEPIQSSK